MLLCLAGCAAREGALTISGSEVGAEAEILRRQVRRFMEEHPGIDVRIQTTPDDAGQRHQLYVQWLNARGRDPDILQMDVIWTAEFAGAGWLHPLEEFAPDRDEFFPNVLEGGMWNGTLYSLPWFVDVGMLYWRTDLMEEAPSTLSGLAERAALVQGARGLRYGLVWQGARYEGLVCVFLEHLGAFGGSILDGKGRVAVDSEAGVRALEFMRQAVEPSGIVPEAALGWREEEVRFAFQNGEAVFMRNWPYAARAMEEDDGSRVAGKFSVAAFPSGPGGAPTAALGGAQLAVNAWSDRPEDAYRLIEFLTRPERMRERARVTGQYPTRMSLYDDEALRLALPLPPELVRRIVEAAVPRPRTPVYSELSEVLQIHLHRCLTGQEEPRAALEAAARRMRALLRRAGLAPAEEG